MVVGRRLAGSALATVLVTSGILFLFPLSNVPQMCRQAESQREGPLPPPQQAAAAAPAGVRLLAVIVGGWALKQFDHELRYSYLNRQLLNYVQACELVRSRAQITHAAAHAARPPCPAHRGTRPCRLSLLLPRFPFPFNRAMM